MRGGKNRRGEERRGGEEKYLQLLVVQPRETCDIIESIMRGIQQAGVIVIGETQSSIVGIVGPGKIKLVAHIQCIVGKEQVVVSIAIGGWICSASYCRGGGRG